MKRAMAMLLLLAATTSCASLQRGSRLPQLSAVREFTIPWPESFPSDVAVDAQGRVWFTDRLHHRIGRFDPVTETFEQFPTPTPRSAPYGMIAQDEHILWFAESGAGRIARLDTRTGDIVEYPVGVSRGGPHMLALRDGVIWFTVRDSMRYGRFDIGTGSAELFQLEGRQRPYSITATRDAVWFNLFETPILVEVDPSTGAATQHALRPPAPPRGISIDSLRALNARIARGAGEVRRIMSDRDGNVWFTDMTRGGIGVWLADEDTMHVLRPPEPGGVAYGIALMRNGLVWFAENARAQVVVQDPQTGERAQAQFTTRGGTVRHIAVDEQRRRVWLPMSDRGVLGLVEYR